MLVRFNDFVEFAAFDRRKFFCCVDIVHVREDFARTVGFPLVLGTATAGGQVAVLSPIKIPRTRLVFS